MNRTHSEESAAKGVVFAIVGLVLAIVFCAGMAVGAMP